MRARALVLIGLAALIPSAIQAQSDRHPADSASQSATSDPASNAGAPYDPYPQIYGPDIVESIVSAPPAQPADVPDPAPDSAGVTYSRTAAVSDSSSASAGVVFSRTAAVPKSATGSAGVTYSRTATVPDSSLASFGVVYSRTAPIPKSAAGSAGVTHTRTAQVSNSSAAGVQGPFQKGYIADGSAADPSVKPDAHGKIQPSTAAKAAFQKQHPCASSGNADGACP